MTRPNFRGGMRCPTDTVTAAAAGGIEWVAAAVVVVVVGGPTKCRGDNDGVADFRCAIISGSSCIGRTTLPNTCCKLLQLPATVWCSRCRCIVQL